MAKVISEDIGAYSHHYPRVATIVTAQAKGKENAMAVAWHMSISFNPPLYGVSISPKRFTYQLIADSKEFGVNFLPFEQAELVASVGGSKGAEIDKFRQFNIAKEKPVKTAVPILEAAYAAYECQLVDDKAYGDHRLLVGEIVAVHLLKEAFTPEETLDLAKINPVLYLGNERYLTVSRETTRHLGREVYGKR
ncbi:MAG: flavin reductase family protein [Dehalococcoidia bacterium]|nr:flavin reductase family protein [Dehalococcoidia bacterium]